MKKEQLVGLTRKKIQRYVEATEKIKPILKGQGPEVQSAVLADLLAIWIVGHAPTLRETFLKMHLELVRQLVPVNEKEIFGGQGHPGGESVQ